jgi:hypothetical protein
MATGPTLKTQSGANKRWYVSRFFHCLLIFSAMTLVFTAVSTRLLSAEAVNYPTGWKFAQFRANPHKPDVLILGSSLTLIPAVRVDAIARGERTRLDMQASFESLNYDKAQYLESKLSKMGIADARVLNMSAIAAMSSDYLMMLETLLQKKCKPELIVCAIAPRDFVCLRHGANIAALTHFRNQLTYIDRTFPEFVLGDKLGGSPLFTAIAEKHFKVLNAWQAMRSCCSSKLLSILATTASKSPFKSNFDNAYLAALSSEPLTYDYEPSFGPRANILSDLEQYKDYYQPPNWSGYGVQKAAFEQLLQKAKAEMIPVAVISMPVTAANLELLDPDLLSAYKKDVREIATKNHAAFYNLQTSDYFKTADFEDSVHLNEFGGKKLFDYLAEELVDMRKGSTEFVAAKNDGISKTD